MNYELAKQLKEAGFPQMPPDFEDKPVPGINLFPEDINIVGSDTEKWVAYAPSLSELIEACGDCDFSLSQHRQEKWGCSANSETIVVTGPTPEEAVAKLWLELNKK